MIRDGAFLARMLVAFLSLAGCDCKLPAPEVEAKQFLQNLQYEYRGVSCTTGDTDNDGYATCLVRLKEPDKSGNEYIPLSCGANKTSGTCSGGCKFK